MPQALASRMTTRRSDAAIASRLGRARAARRSSARTYRRTRRVVRALSDRCARRGSAVMDSARLMGAAGAALFHERVAACLSTFPGGSVGMAHGVLRPRLVPREGVAGVVELARERG